MTHVYRERTFRCDACDVTVALWRWDTDPSPICGTCSRAMDEYSPTYGVSAAVAPDDIPGGVLIRHAICHPDGTPKRYYSKSEIRKAARESGWTIYGETPKAPERGYPGEG